jgi:SPP1 family predicted phage head-tail adaptor
VYKVKHKTGELNCRPIFENWTFTTDEAGGLLKTLSNSFYAWSKIQPRMGSIFADGGQMVWTYDSVFVVRYNPNIVSSSTIVWGNTRYIIKELSIEDDGKLRYMVIRASKADLDLVTSGIVTPVGPAYVFNYEGIGGETVIDIPINKTLIGVFKDGVSKEIIFIGVPDDGQALYSPITGELTFAIPFYQGEKLQVQYI